jgi:MerR family transcriptional regulator, light-induced transcriptional regulator
MHGLPQSLSSPQALEGTHWSDRLQQCPDPCDGAQPSKGASVAGNEARARLACIVEAKIIPRLLEAHSRKVSAPTGGAPRPPLKVRSTAVAVDGLIESVLVGDLARAVRLVESLCWSGASLESLCIEVVAPVARRLGDLWTNDHCDYATIAIALWRLQQLLLELAGQFPSMPATRERGQRALLLPAPGEGPSLALALVMSSFSLAGWRVACTAPASVGQLRERVVADWFEVAGLAVSSQTCPRLLARSIDTLRKSSHNPGVRVLVGGPLLARQPELAAAVGADGPWSDQRYAPRRDEALFGLLTGTNCG